MCFIISKQLIHIFVQLGQVKLHHTLGDFCIDFFQKKKPPPFFRAVGGGDVETRKDGELSVE